MVVGYDTYNDSSKKGKACGACVCSSNGSLSRYYSRVSYHANFNEMSDNFSKNFERKLIF